MTAASIISEAPGGARGAAGESLLFEFERDLYPRFHCIPMAVRYKLDCAGLKVSLRAWNRLPLSFRHELLHDWPVETDHECRALRAVLLGWLQETSDEPVRELSMEAAPWDDLSRLPLAVAEQGSRCTPPLQPEEWAQLPLLGRVALVKLAQSDHERGRFGAAVAEFRRSGKPAQSVESDRL